MLRILRSTPIVIFFFILLAYGMAEAQQLAVPLKIQVAIFKKVFAYDSILQQAGNVSIVIVHSNKYASMAGEVSDAFKQSGFATSTVSLSDLGSNVNANTVVYALLEEGLDTLKSVCTSKQILSISGLPELVEDGNVSVALGVTEEGKPLPIVHFNRLQEEGHELSAQVLKLARVIRVETIQK